MHYNICSAGLFYLLTCSNVLSQSYSVFQDSCPKIFFNFQFCEEADVLETNFQCQIGSPISFAAAYRSNTRFSINCAVFEVNAQKSSKMKILDELRLDRSSFFIVTVEAGLLQGGLCKRSMLKNPEIFISRQFNINLQNLNMI